MGCGASKSVETVQQEQRPNSANAKMMANVDVKGGNTEGNVRVEASKPAAAESASKAEQYQNGAEKDAPSAATDIQRAWRGKKGRESAQERKEEKIRDENAIIIQSAWRGAKARKKVDQKKADKAQVSNNSGTASTTDNGDSDKPENGSDEYFAQAADDEPTHDAPAPENDELYFRQQEEASVAIQKSWRGFKAREEVKAKKEQKDAKEGTMEPSTEDQAPSGEANQEENTTDQVKETEVEPDQDDPLPPKEEEEQDVTRQDAKEEGSPEDTNAEEQNAPPQEEIAAET
eukprot:CAMPEP_0117442428 /NCGR_PEP_ID=MMETSP0759-20121206/4145_1 /TAXON_ID=63605 /ORGANISM="Percolomonas cosmopolitus, Strain WS" /LENGTH=288 /DNA_ID=CAMNT_0005234313 /DNA_START=43 /DNA_END=909 /DNA_ORIENTATION=-